MSNENENIEIIKFDPKYKTDFRNLNVEWLEKYFKVEEEDIGIFNEPEKIIEDGGEIFLARKGNEIIGTAAIIKHSANEFELGKMSVTEKYQGKHLGEKLAVAAIDFAKKQGAKRVILETNSKLVPAINLYKKLGFVQIELDPNSKYIRCNVRMSLEF